MILSLLRQLRFAGTSFATPVHSANVEASNLGALVGAAGSLLFATVLAAAGLTAPALVSLAALPLYAPCIWLSARGSLDLARLWLGTLFVTEILLLTYFLSTQSGFHVVLLAGIPMGFVLFNPDEPWLRAGGVAASLAAFVLTLLGHWTEPLEPVSHGWMLVFVLISLGTTFGGLTVVIERFIRALNLREAQQREFATTDDLTKLPNRRHTLDKAGHLLNVASRYERAFSIILVDIDHFKSVNDSHGHLAGDRILRQVAARISSSPRAADLVGRYGGEEFVIVLPETPIGGARTFADRIRRQVEAEPFDLGTGHQSLTISLGIAAPGPREKLSLDEVLHRADEALYAAKRGGRNRVETWKSPAE
jgi:diguanylate cyclase (GGDEF)-like protein